MIETSSIYVWYLENKAGELTVGEYFLPIAKIVNIAQRIVTRALLIINNFIVGITSGDYSIYLLRVHRKYEIDNLSSFGIVVLIKFDISY